ncbi:hypothetical protein [Carboxydothermus islandicus]|uniref:hypothetical protein n=1 Tax=Carboxydothermus islandicus TaxID=661089 RepID=UPI0011777EEF|nr:hypothetical protein [Carboxydothermus islandicus]
MKVMVMTFSVMLPELSFTCTLIGLEPSDSVTIMLTSAFFVPTAITLPAVVTLSVLSLSVTFTVRLLNSYLRCYHLTAKIQ